MTTISFRVALLGSVAFLAACGGGGGGGGASGPVYEEVPQAIPNGQEMVTRSVGVFDSSNPDVASDLLSLSNATIEFNTQDNITITVGGETYELQRDENLGGVYTSEPGQVDEYLLFWEFDDTGGNYARLAELEVTNALRHGLVIGNPTDAASMPIDGTATLVGAARVYTTRDGGNFAIDETFADVAFEADFVNSVISGAMDLEGTSLLMPETAISGNGFDGELVSIDPSYQIGFTDVNGQFFGPNGEEVGGNFGFIYADQVGLDVVTGTVAGVFHADVVPAD